MRRCRICAGATSAPAQDDLMTIFPFADQAELRRRGARSVQRPDPRALRRRAAVRSARQAEAGHAVLDRSLLRPCRRGLDGRLRRPGAGRRALGRRGRHGGTARLPEQLRARLRLSGRPALAVERAGPGPGGVGRPEPGRRCACSRWTTCCPAALRARRRPAHLLDAVARRSPASAITTCSRRRSARRHGRCCSWPRRAS